MKYQIKKYCASILLMGVAIFFGSCSKEDPVVDEGVSQLRVINSVDGSANQDFYQANNKLNTSPIIYGASSTTVSARAGLSVLEFRAAGSGTVTASENIAIAPNRIFSVYLTKRTDGSLQITGIENDQNAPEAGKSKVRFLNLAGLATAGVTVTDGSTALVTGLAVRGASSYYQVNPGANLSAVVVGSADVTVISGVEFVAGKNYTVWFDNVSTTKVKYFVTLDRG
ncbi:MAG: DUF4397 domain-containing protein [Pedobacter sp.]|nr:MAG: DUF4397 domain-containing protein [Pedobacter sp.]